MPSNGKPHRNDDESPPWSVTIQLAGRAAVKGNFTDDEQVIANPVPYAFVAGARLLAAQRISKAPPLLVGGVGLLQTLQPHKSAFSTQTVTASVWAMPS